MKHCLPCNLGFSDDRHFCGSCGGSLNDSTTCQFCGDIIESKWKFCTGCGNTLRRTAAFENPLSSVQSTGEVKHASDPANSVAPEWYVAPELFRDRDETTIESRRPANFIINPDLSRKYASPGGPTENGETRRNGKDVPTLSMLSAYGEPESGPRLRVAPRYPIVLSAALIVLFVMASFGGWYVWAHRASARASQAQAPPTQEQSAMGNQFAPAPAEEPSADRGKSENADDAWEHLKQERINASPADTDAVVAALQQAERKFPNDYRFPYERAKLSIKGVTSHHEAFAALASAAEKAIDNGQAQQMLDNLKADADGDFWKPSHGHHEWHALLEALEHKNKTELSDLRH